MEKCKTFSITQVFRTHPAWHTFADTYSFIQPSASDTLSGLNILWPCHTLAIWDKNDITASGWISSAQCDEYFIVILYKFKQRFCLIISFLIAYVAQIYFLCLLFIENSHCKYITTQQMRFSIDTFRSNKTVWYVERAHSLRNAKSAKHLTWMHRKTNKKSAICVWFNE